jgi:imidazolonepropionase-like amidohydrolase
MPIHEATDAPKTVAKVPTKEQPMISYRSLILALVPCLLVWCSTPAAGAPAVNGTVVLAGVRLIDSNGGQPMIGANIVIVNGRIEAAGPADQVRVPAGAEVIDLKGKTVIPGLISDHSHVGVVDGTGTAEANYTRDNVLRQLRQYEAYGITTVTALGLNGPAFYPLRDELHAGTISGADLFGADRGFGVPDGAPPLAWAPTNSDRVDRPATSAQARAAVRAAAARKTDFIKLWLDDFRGSVKVKMPPEVYRAIIDEAHKQKLRVAAHVYYLADAKALIDAGVDVIAHGVRDKPVDDEFIRAAKAAGIWYVPTLGLDESFYLFADRPAFIRAPFCLHALQPALRAQFDDPNWVAKVRADKTIALSRDALKMNQRNLQTLHGAGVKIGFGTDSGATPLRVPGFAEHRELQLMTEAGLTPLQAITAATRDAAALLGLSDRGVLAPGKLADLVVLDADPAEQIANTSRIVAVWHRGKRVSGLIKEFAP